MNAKPREIKKCPVCETLFIRPKKMGVKEFNKRIYCCRKCGKLKFPEKEYLQNKLQYILSKTVTTSTGCMEWQGSLSKRGYGSINILKKSQLVHRIVWILVNGDTDLFILHSCDNPKCINIDHLFLGTNQDNMDDMKNKGRQLKGYDKYNCKVADDEKIHLLKMAKKGIPYKDIAKEFGICKQNANNIALTNGIRRNSVKRIYHDNHQTEK